VDQYNAQEFDQDERNNQGEEEEVVLNDQELRKRSRP
jgi:hypothetical protein